MSSTTSDNTTVIIEAQPNLNTTEDEYRNIGQQLTKIIYNSQKSSMFKSNGGNSTLIIQFPKTNNSNRIVNILKGYIIDIALQAKKNNIQIEIRE